VYSSVPESSVQYSRQFAPKPYPDLHITGAHIHILNLEDPF